LEGHKEIYRSAFDAATAELTEIIAEFEKLLVRKEQVEKLVSVLRQYFGEESSGPILLPESAAREATTAGATANETTGEPQTTPSDPFQRRIDHVLGIGAGIRGVRKYSRQF